MQHHIIKFIHPDYFKCKPRNSLCWRTKEGPTIQYQDQDKSCLPNVNFVEMTRLISHDMWSYQWPFSWNREQYSFIWASCLQHYILCFDNWVDFFLHKNEHLCPSNVCHFCVTLKARHLSEFTSGIHVHILRKKDKNLFDYNVQYMVAL